MKIDRVNLYKWIEENTKNSTSVVELGAMFFEKLKYVHPSVKQKIGIEIWKPYVDSKVDCYGNPVYNDCIRIHGDILHYKELLSEYKLHTAMLIDVLEHFDELTAINLIEDLKKNFKKILVMAPEGKFEQTCDESGFGAHEYQTHKSFWYENNIKNLNLSTITLDPLFHYEDVKHKQDFYYGSWFCVWSSED